MTEQKRMPAFRLKYRSADKQNYDCGVCWPGKFDGSFDVKPETQRTDGQYPKMPLSEAIRRVEARDGWLTLQAVRPGGGNRNAGGPPPAPESYGDGFNDDEIPF